MKQIDLSNLRAGWADIARVVTGRSDDPVLRAQFPDAACFPVNRAPVGFERLDIDFPLPRNPFAQLTLDERAAFCAEGIFRDLGYRERFDPARGYLHNSNKEIVDAIWGRVFERLTGERLEDCVHIEVHNADAFLCRVNKIQRTSSNYGTRVWDTDITGAFALNIYGPIVILQNLPGLQTLNLGFHEIGHRVFRASEDKYASEFGSYYFNFLATERTARELKSIGIRLNPLHVPQDSTYSQPMRDAARTVQSMGARFITT